jgi:hypothetical protein
VIPSLGLLLAAALRAVAMARRLLTDSVEECEALCSRIAIMVGGASVFPQSRGSSWTVRKCILSKPAAPFHPHAPHLHAARAEALGHCVWPRFMCAGPLPQWLLLLVLLVLLVLCDCCRRC